MGAFGAWVGGLWPGGGDAEDAVLAAEARLGVRLPDLLREYYANCSLRRGSMSQVCPLDAVKCVDGCLVFGADQQNTLSYAVDLADPEREVVQGVPGGWAGAGVSLESHLRLTALLNRAYAEPCAELTVDESEGPPPGWVAWLLEVELWTNGRAVYDPQNGWLGACDLDALRAAAQQLSVDPEDLEQEPLSIVRPRGDPVPVLRRAAEARMRGDLDQAEELVWSLADRLDGQSVVLVALALVAVGRQDWREVDDSVEAALRAEGDRRPAEALRAWLDGAPVSSVGLASELWPELLGPPPVRSSAWTEALPPLPSAPDPEPSTLRPRPILEERLAQCARHRRLGQWEAAESIVLAVLSHHDDDPRPWVALGLIELARGARRDAIDACAAALTRVGDRRCAVALRARLAGEPPPPGVDAVLWPERVA